VSEVVLSNLTIEYHRHDWFWWGDGDPIHFNIKRRSEVHGTPHPNEPPVQGRFAKCRSGTWWHMGRVPSIIAKLTPSSQLSGCP
jgi:hypothetical protein